MACGPSYQRMRGPKEPTVQSLIHMNMELEENVLEELPLGAGPRVGAKMGKKEKVSRAACGHPDEQQGQPQVTHTAVCPSQSQADPTMGL